MASQQVDGEVSAEKIHEQLLEILNRIDGGDLANTVDSQMQVIKLLNETLIKDSPQHRLLDVMTPGQRQQVLKRMCVAIGWVRDGAPLTRRLQAVLDLRERGVNKVMRYDVIAQRRALQHRQIPRDDTEPGSHLYPKSGWLGNYLNMVHDNEAPLAFHFWSGVSAFGACLRRNFVVDRKMWYLYPNFYLMIVGPTASLKSTSMNCATRIIENTNDEVMRLQLQEPPGTAATPQLDRRIIVIPELSSPEFVIHALDSGNFNDGGRIFVKESVGILVNDEVSGLIGKDVKGAGRFIKYATQLYDCKDKYDRGTLTRGESNIRN